MSTHSPPVIARLFMRLLACIFATAWLSLAAQWKPLFGLQGLLPVATFMARLEQMGASFADIPTVFWWNCSDAWLEGGIWLGVAFAVAAAVGLWPRLMIALSTALYLSYVSAGRTFLSFQWDNLLLECGLLASFLPTDRRSRWMPWIFRLLLFKLYWESGIAKWQSGLNDWQDGSAMTYYYETAPLPTWLAYYTHHWPVWWHHLESWGTLFLELVVPLLAFGPQTARWIALVALTGFQVANLLTTNYGFFVPLALALHLFLLRDAEVGRVGAFMSRGLFGRLSVWRGLARWLDRGAAISLGVFFMVLSVNQAGVHFAEEPTDTILFGGALEPWRLINTYHLFGSITRERIEPEVQVDTGHGWKTFDLWHKPGAVDRAPDFVAPHQPRLDFQLWFHGLAPRQTPDYVASLLQHLCYNPSPLQPLFRDPLPTAPRAVRLVYWQYHFTDHNEGNAWWRRELVAARPEMPCAVGP